MGFAHESPFWFETHEDIKAEMMIFTILEPYPGKFTGLTFQLMFILTIKDALIDGEPKCGEFFIEPPECEGVKEAYKPITNIYSRTRDFFFFFFLSEGISINSIKVTDPNMAITEDLFKDKFIISKGKKTHIKVNLVK